MTSLQLRGDFTGVSEVPERKRDGPPAPLPNAELRDVWVDRALSFKPALRFYIEERLLTTDVIERYRLGWCVPKDWNWPDHSGAVHAEWKSPCATFEARWPARDGVRSRLVDVRRRVIRPRDPKYKYLSLKNAPVTLYPDLPKGDLLIITAGELDALLLRRIGWPSVSSTGGAAAPWSDRWVQRVARCYRKVVWLFDAGAGEFTWAATHAARFRDAGVGHCHVAELDRVGVPAGEDATWLAQAHGLESLDEFVIVEAAK
jgi:hypothetical protein